MLVRTRYLRYLVAVGLAAAALAGCGDDSGSNSPYAKATISDEQKVQLVIADFYGASSAQICDSLSSGALEELGGRSACLDRAKPVATDYNVQSVRFDDTGEAIAVVRVGGKPVQFTLIDEDGDYKVSKPLPQGS
jgi:hypothetical protein